MHRDVDNARLRRLLAEQDGLVSQAQLPDVGITRSALRWRLRTRRWRTLLPGVFATSTGVPTLEQQYLAAIIYAGQGSQLTGAAALRCHGVRYVPKDRHIRVLVPAERQVRSVGSVRVHRTGRLDASPWRRGRLTVCQPARAAADAARCCRSLREIRALVAEVVQRRLATVTELKTELERGTRANSALLRRAVDEVADGVRSAPEAELRALLATSRVLPRLRWNPRLRSPDGTRLPTPDGWIPDVGIALEVDSREHHLSPDDWQATMARHNLLGEHGVLVLHFPPSQIRTAPADVLCTIEHAYLERLRSGALSVIITS